MEGPASSPQGEAGAMADEPPESPSSRSSFIGNFESYLKELEDELNISISSIRDGSVIIGKEMMLKTSSGDGDDDDNAMSEYLRLDRPEFDLNNSPDKDLSPSAAYTPMSIRDILLQDEDGDSTVDRFLFALQDTMGSEKTQTVQTPVQIASSSASSRPEEVDTNHFVGSALNDDDYKPRSPQWASIPVTMEVYVPNNDHLMSYDVTASQLDDSCGSRTSSTDDLDLSPAPRHGSTHPDDERILGDFAFYGEKDRLTLDALRKAYCGISEAIVPSSRDPTVNKDPSAYSTLYLLECIIRPDIDLPRVMKCLELVALAPGGAPLDFNLHRTNHATMAFKEKPSLLSWSAEGGAQPDWDSIDVQVCISRELRQRVLIFQFMRKSTTYNKAVKDFLSMYADAPARDMFVKAVRNVLSSSRLCLSNLYTMTASEVCLDGGLDVDFKIKLHHLCRESVWDDLKEDFQALDEHMKTVEVQCARFMATIDPIYKAHGVKMPAPLPRKKLSEFPLSVDLSALNNVSNIEHEDEESDEEEEQEDDYDDGDDDDDGYYGLLDQPERRGSGGLTLAPGKATNFNILTSLGKLSASPLSEGPSLASKFTPSRKGHVHGKGRHEENNADALAVCLGLLTHCTKILQRRCDVEITARLQQRNEYTVAIISDLCDYRKLLIMHLARSVEAHSSPLNKSYLKTFAGVDCISTPSCANPSLKTLSPAPSKKDRTENLLMLDDYAEDDDEAGNSAAEDAEGDTTSTVVNYLYENLISTGAPAPAAQRPAFAKPVLRSRTMEQVKERLEAYRRSDTDTHRGDSLSTISSAERSKSLLKSLLPSQGSAAVASKGEAGVALKVHDNVIYYCACLVGGVPGKLYLTAHHIGLSYGVLGISTAKELLPLRALSLVSFQAPGSSILAANTLRLTFFGGSMEYLISPMMVECNRIRTMIVDTLDSVRDEEGGDEEW